MRVFKTKAFTRFAAKAGISDVALCHAVRDAERGLIAADLGGGIIKQRVARAGQGKSGGFRTILAFRAGAMAIYVHGFAKNEIENIQGHELLALKKLASKLLAYDDRLVTLAAGSGVLVEVNCDEETIS